MSEEVTSLVAQMVKRLLTMRETRVQSLGREDMISWRRKWQPTPVFLPGKSHGRKSLVGYSLWGRKDLDTTERLHFHFHWRGEHARTKGAVEAVRKSMRNENGSLLLESMIKRKAKSD